MPALADYQERVKTVCFGPEPATEAVASLGDEAWRWHRYRTMVRRRLLGVVEHALPRFVAAVGVEQVALLFDRFLSEGGPGSPFVRDVPGELLGWLEASEASREIVPSALDLARYEWARQSTSYAADGPSPTCLDLDMARPGALLHAHRLLALSHPVHRDDRTGADATFLCIYRDPATHDVKTLELTPAAHALLEEIESGDRSVSAAIALSAERVGAPVDRTFLEATSALIADFLQRGLLLGGTGSR